MKKKNLLKAIDKNKTREIRHLSRKRFSAARVEAAPAAPAPAPVLHGPRALPQGALADTRPAAARRQPEAPALELAPSSQPRSSPQLHRIALLTPTFDSRGLSQVLAGAPPTPSPSLDRAVPIRPLLTSLRTPPQAQHAPATPESRAQSRPRVGAERSLPLSHAPLLRRRWTPRPGVLGPSRPRRCSAV